MRSADGAFSLTSLFPQYVNPAFEKLAGFKSIDMVGKSTDVLLNEEKTGAVRFFLSFND